MWTYEDLLAAADAKSLAAATVERAIRAIVRWLAVPSDRVRRGSTTTEASSDGVTVTGELEIGLRERHEPVCIHVQCVRDTRGTSVRIRRRTNLAATSAWREVTLGEFSDEEERMIARAAFDETICAIEERPS